MQNLKTDFVISLKDTKIENVKHWCCDAYSNCFYTINGCNQLISIEEKSIIECAHFNWSPLSEGKTTVEAMVWLLDEMSVCIGFANGDVVLYNTQTNETTCAANLSKGVRSITPSPDQELFVVITADDTFILMDKMFDIICEKSVHSSEFGCQEAVNVGWGSKQTQFHGSEGKEARKQTEAVSPALAADDKIIRVDWKSDGNYFAISSIDTGKLCRKIRIWNSEGNLHYTSEDVNGLEHFIAWKPSGNLLASSQRSQNKHEIIFFEKNGLRHGQFSLPYNSETFTIETISWSCDSKILLILGTEHQKSNQVIMLWTCSNYHWYQKQNILLENQRVCGVLWDPFVPLKLSFVTEDGNFFQYQWSWVTSSADDVVAVIDGTKVLITTFRSNVIPPPMFGFALKFAEPLNQVTLNTNYQVVACQRDGTVVSFRPPSNTDQLSLSSSFNAEIVVNCNVQDKYICCESLLRHYMVRQCFVNNATIFVIATKDFITDELIVVKNNTIRTLMTFSTQIFSVCFDDEDCILAVQQRNKSVLKCDILKKSSSPWKDDNQKDVTFQECCSLMKIATVNHSKKVFGLSERFTLYCNNTTLVTNSCTSFVIHNKQFLLFTTTDHFLRCWSLDRDVQCYLKEKCLPKTEEKRRIERGAKIVASVSREAKLILQMPRGNLESIFPRVVLLQRIKELLDECNYETAFGIMKKHRINLNLLVDHNTAIFIENIDKVINQIGNSDVLNICLLLTELFEDNVCVSMYSYAYDSYVPIELKQSKLDLVCDTLKRSMKQMDSKKFLLPILVTYVKKSEPEIGEALLEVKALESLSDRESALKYLLYLTDFNRLYEEALGTYDFDVVLMVAHRSNKDPKEYISFINELRDIKPEMYRNYKIDVYLKRYKKALCNISLCEGDMYFSESLQLIEKHHLFREAIDLYKGSEVKKIWKKYGDYLLVKKCFEEAAVAFKFSGEYYSALKAYQLSGNWNAAVDVSYAIKDMNHHSFYLSLAENLKSEGKFQQAAYVYETLVVDVKEAAVTFVKGRLWDHALRLIHRLSDDELNKYFENELLDQFDFVLNSTKNHRDQLRKYVDRFSIVKKTKFDSENNADDDFDVISDAVSDVSSISDSNSVSGSLRTRKSSRSKKKRERKKYTLKEGSPNEFEALLFAMKEVCEKVDAMQQEVALLIKTLYCHHFFEKANHCQNAFSDLMTQVTNAISLVWPEDDCVTAPDIVLSDAGTRQLKYMKSIASDPKLFVAPQMKKCDWKFALLTCQR